MGGGAARLRSALLGTELCRVMTHHNKRQKVNQSSQRRQWSHRGIHSKEPQD